MIFAINNSALTNSKHKNLSFKGNDADRYIDTSYSADKFIKDIENVVATQKKGDFFSRYIWSTTAFTAGILMVLSYEIFTLLKMRKLKKSGQSELLQATGKSFKKVFPWVVVGALALYAGLEYIFSKNFDNKYEKLKQDFKKINTSTSAKLVDYTISSNVMGALCSPISGEVVINRNMLNDPISRRRILKLVKHELVHAKQYETIARSENGIKKLNYAVALSSAKAVDSPQGRAEIAKVYDDIMNDKTGKYDNKVLSIIGADVNMKDYIVAINTIFTKKDCSADDIPMLIDVKHYEKVREQKGKLTLPEEYMAKMYYQAQIDYPKTTTWNMLNPFSDYYDNLLEKEAYKESPNLMTFIRKICGKQ